MRQLVANRPRLKGFIASNVLIACALAGPCIPGCGPDSRPEAPPGFARALNRGKAHLENRDAALAIEAFQEAVELEPESAAALRNLARSYLMAREMEPLADTLASARALERESVATSYLSGLTHARQSQFEAAVADFEAAVRLDPHTAALRFQLANSYQALTRHAEATEQLRETVRLDPFHAAAQHRLAGYARRAGDRDELDRRLRELARLQNLFGDQSRSSELIEACRYTLAEPAAGTGRPEEARTSTVRFRDATDEMLPAGPERTAEVAAAAVLDVDASGRYTLFAAGADGRASLLTRGRRWGPPAHRARRGAVRGGAREPPPREPRGQHPGNVPEETRDFPAQQLRNDLLLLGDGGTQLLERDGPRSVRGRHFRSRGSPACGGTQRAGSTTITTATSTCWWPAKPGSRCGRTAVTGSSRTSPAAWASTRGQPVRDVAAADLDATWPSTWWRPAARCPPACSRTSARGASRRSRSRRVRGPPRGASWSTTSTTTGTSTRC